MLTPEEPAPTVVTGTDTQPSALLKNLNPSLLPPVDDTTPVIARCRCGIKVPTTTAHYLSLCVKLQDIQSDLYSKRVSPNLFSVLQQFLIYNIILQTVEADIHYRQWKLTFIACIRISKCNSL